MILAAAYYNFFRQSQRLQYQIFDFTVVASWQETKNGIYRVDARGNVESMLLSKDAWKELQLSFVLLNPRDCGVIYNYRDADNFHFIYFNRGSDAIIFGENKNGQLAVLKKEKFIDLPLLRCILKIHSNQAQLAVNGRPYSQMDIPAGQGKIGLMIMDAKGPATVFRNISLSGKTVNGESLSIQSDSASSAPAGWWGGMIGLFVMMLGVSVYLARWYMLYRQNKTGSSEDKEPVHFFAAAGVHLGIAALLFWPFFSRGEILISSADNFGEIFPLFFLSKHNFLNILGGESLALWNPYAHNGIPFFSNHWNMLYYPLNWPIFFLPDAQVMTALTFKMFLEVFLLGVCAYGFFKIELNSSRWALFSSVTCQLCSLLIFTLTIFPTISLFFAMTFYLYIVWSLEQRKLLWNYLLLTFSMVLVLTSANTAFTLYGGLALVVLTVYRAVNVWAQDRRQIWVQGGTIGMAAVTAVLISAVRILPCIAGVMDSNRIVENYYTIQDRIPLVMRLFLPEMTGWLGSNSLNALTSSNLNFASRWLDLPSNSQNAFFVYFGIIAGLFLLLNIFIKTEGRHTFWKIYAFVTIALGLMIQPLWGTFNILLFPFNHYSYYIILLPIGVCALIGYTGQYLENKNFRFSEMAPRLSLGVLVIQIYLLVLFTYLFPVVTVYTKWILLVLLAGFIFYKRGGEGFNAGRQLLIGAVLGVSFFFISTVLFIKPLPKKEVITPFFLIPVLEVLIMMLLATYLYENYLKNKTFKLRKSWVVFCVTVPAFAGWLVHAPLFDHWLSAPEAERVYWSDFLLGEMKFVLIVSLFFLILGLFEKKAISRRLLWGLLFVITLGDLLAFNARFDNVVAPTPHGQAFYPAAAPYRDMGAALKKSLDLVNYRAHMLDEVGLNANKNLIFGVPSYSGIMGHMPKRFSSFIINFGYPRETVLIYPSEASRQERFLDLSAVRYVFTEKEKAGERPTALARLNLLYDYQVINDEPKLLEELKKETFNPKTTVLLSQDPQWPVSSGERRSADAVPIATAGTDAVTAEVSVPRSALLLFAESYDRGWQAFIDDKPAPVYPANYNFMACPISAGQHKVTFKFLPPLFFLSLKLSLVGGILLLILSGYCFLLSQPKKS